MIYFQRCSIVFGLRAVLYMLVRYLMAKWSWVFQMSDAYASPVKLLFMLFKV